jgi:hypothetical protein
MFVVTILTMLLATVTSAIAKHLSTVPILNRRDINPYCYFGGHHPTEKIYLEGVTQYCNNHVHDSISLKDGQDLVATLTLKDSADCPINWIYKMQWKGDASADSVYISHNMCLEKFREFTDNSICPDGLIKFILGGKKPTTFENKPDSTLWVETRQRTDDVYPHSCKQNS